MLEFTPTGEFLGETALPTGVSGLSGIAILGSTGEAWVCSTSGGGTVWRLAGIPICEPADINCDSAVNIDDLLAVIGAWGTCKNPPCTADVTGNGVVDIDDLLAVIGGWGSC